MNLPLTRLAGAFVQILLLCACHQPPNDMPNIIVILADDLGWRDTSIYGSEFYQTPAIDQLASQGIRFTNAYAASPLCSPTRASLLTGQYPARLRLTTANGHLAEALLDPQIEETASMAEATLTPQSRTRLPNTTLTYAEVLKKAGYRTAFMGKWHLGHPPYIPENQGFDVVRGGRAHSGPPGPGHYFAPWDIDTLPASKPGTHIADVLTDEAIKFIKDGQGQPFLLNLWFYDVHAPFQAPAELIAKFSQLTDGVGQDSPTMAAMVAKMDDNVGRIMAALKTENISENTIIIFTSDNGGNMYDRIDGTTPTDNAPLRGGKGINYEGGVKVPLIVTWPGVISEARVSDALVSSIDLFPTILELVGIDDDSADIDGYSFFNALMEQPQSQRPLFSHFPHYVQITGNLPNTSVIQDRWKLYRFYHDGPDQTHRYELYDLVSDVSEERNLADQHPDIVLELDRLIELHLQKTNALVPIPNPGFDDSQQIKWIAQGHTAITQDNGVLIITSSGVDPMIRSHSAVTTRAKIDVQFEMQSNSSGTGQLFWTTAATPHFNEENSQKFAVIHDGDWHSYTISVAAQSSVQLIRLDPSTAPGTIRIRSIAILEP